MCPWQTVGYSTRSTLLKATACVIIPSVLQDTHDGHKRPDRKNEHVPREMAPKEYFYETYMTYELYGKYVKRAVTLGGGSVRIKEGAPSVSRSDA